MKKYVMGCVALVLLTATLPNSMAQGKERSVIKLAVLDQQGNELTALTPGMTGAIALDLDVAQIPERLNASVTIRARVTADIRGRQTRYSFNIPVRTNLGSTRNPDPDSDGGIIGSEYIGLSERAEVPFSLPENIPDGALRLIVTIKSSGTVPLKESFNFAVERR
jgi:hypothetical protein